MKKFNCLIVEDEPLAAEIIRDYINEIPFLDLKGICSDAISATQFLHKDQIDVLFLDIHLPKIKGNEFIRSLNTPPQTIITTADRDYAIEAYELNVIDYLIKPISFNRFFAAVSKLREKVDKEPHMMRGYLSNEPDHFFFNTNKKRVKVRLDDILYIESLKEYIRITTKEKTVLTKFQLWQVEEMLAKNNFIRVHRSFLVARDKIDAYSAVEIEVSGKQIPIGRSYKELVTKLLGERA